MKTMETNPKAQFENYFAEDVTYESFLWTHSNVRIESELPLLLKVNDPWDSLDIKQEEKDKMHYVEINLKKPTFEVLFHESENSYRDPAQCTRVSVSSEKDYTKIGQQIAKMYQPIFDEPLPQELETIKSLVSKEMSEVDCIDTAVTSLLDKLTYLSTFNTLEGHYAPRSLETIIKSGYGDCKEFSSCLAAILNKLGYTAKIACVYRGDVYLDRQEDLPNIGKDTNHIIAKVIAPSGKIYWIDPTNAVSMADGIFPDIADRPALVLDLKNPTYERIPAIDYQHAVTRQQKTYTFQEDETVVIENVFRIEGGEAIHLTENLTKYPLSLIKGALIKVFCDSSDPISPNVQLPESRSPKVRPIEGSLSYGDNHFINHTNLGNAFPLKSKWSEKYTSASSANEGSLYVGPPRTWIRKEILKNVTAKDLHTLEFSIKTPWLNANRELSLKDEGIIVIETVEILKSLISSQDLKSDQFNELKKTLRKYCSDVSLIFKDKNDKQ
jgi:hypothetical protein